MGNPDELYKSAMIKRGELNSKLVLRCWEDDGFRREFLSDPKRALERETGQKVPESVNLHALEEAGDKIYLVIPEKPSLPKASEALTDEALAGVAAGLGVVFRAASTDLVKGTAVQKDAVLLVWFD